MLLPNVLAKDKEGQVKEGVEITYGLVVRIGLDFVGVCRLLLDFTVEATQGGVDAAQLVCLGRGSTYVDLVASNKIMIDFKLRIKSSRDLFLD